MPQSSDCYEVSVPYTKMFSNRSNHSSPETELLFGEPVRVVNLRDGFALVETKLYSSAGFVNELHLRGVDRHRRSVGEAFRIIVPRAPLFLGNTFKEPDPDDRMLTVNSIVRVRTGNFSSTAEGEMAYIEGLDRWLFKNHFIPEGQFLKDYVALALSYVGITYVWGGRFYPDCSALVQQVLLACNIMCPRNVSEQVRMLGQEVDFAADFSNLKRGDFVFWNDPATKGSHVAIMVDGTHCVHATIFDLYRCVVVQPLTQVIVDQIHKKNGQPTVVRRFPGYRLV